MANHQVPLQSFKLCMYMHIMRSVTNMRLHPVVSTCFHLVQATCVVYELDVDSIDQGLALSE